MSYETLYRIYGVLEDNGDVKINIDSAEIKDMLPGGVLVTDDPSIVENVYHLNHVFQLDDRSCQCMVVYEVDVQEVCKIIADKLHSVPLRCYNCGSVIKGDVIYKDGKTYCDRDCMEESTAFTVGHCVNCGRSIMSTDEEVELIGGEWFCAACADKMDVDEMLRTMYEDSKNTYTIYIRRAQ